MNLLNTFEYLWPEITKHMDDKLKPQEILLIRSLGGIFRRFREDPCEIHLYAPMKVTSQKIRQYIAVYKSGGGSVIDEDHSVPTTITERSGNYQR